MYKMLQQSIDKAQELRDLIPEALLSSNSLYYKLLSEWTIHVLALKSIGDQRPWQWLEELQNGIWQIEDKGDVDENDLLVYMAYRDMVDGLLIPIERVSNGSTKTD